VAAFLSRKQSRSSFLGDELSAGSFGCGDDFFEARIATQPIPKREQFQIA